MVLAGCAPYGSDGFHGPPQYKALVLSDDFNGTTLNDQIWTPYWYISGSPVQSQELACYSPSQVRVQDGYLDLVSKVQSTTCGGVTRPYVSGYVQSRGKKDFSPPVYVEARMDLECVDGQIVNWPAWWLNGYGPWPATGEFDVMEGLSGSASATWHGPEGQSNFGRFGSACGWHIFGALWEPTRVTSYYDGVWAGTYYSTTNITQSPQYLNFGNQISPENRYGGPVKVPNHVRVDWVRVWKP